MMNEEFEMTEDESIQFEKDYERFSIIQDENNFKTEWCLYEIENVNEDSELSADIITNGLKRDKDFKVELPNKKLLKEFKKVSGTPILLNTSFNIKDKTMVLTPKDAIDTFFDTEMDLLVIGNHVLYK